MPLDQEAYSQLLIYSMKNLAIAESNQALLCNFIASQGAKTLEEAFEYADKITKQRLSEGTQEVAEILKKLNEQGQK